MSSLVEATWADEMVWQLDTALRMSSTERSAESEETLLLSMKKKRTSVESIIDGYQVLAFPGI